MRATVSLLVAAVTVWSGLAGVAWPAAPATPSYHGVERTIQTIRQDWSRSGAAAQPNRPGWDALFDTLLADLQAYTKAAGDEERLSVLEHAYLISQALSTVSWHPAVNLREELRQWLRPRLRLAWAARRLSETVQALPATSDSHVRSNRQRWVDFTRNELGAALHDYDQAATVAQRTVALRRIHEALRALEAGNRERPWWPSTELEAAVTELFNRPNVDVSADPATVAPILDVPLIQTGPVYRKGYVSQVTAGPKTGFGLLASDDGIAFYNSQLYTSVTPVWDFQNRIASNPQGQRATKLYQFSATTYDWAELTITTVLKGSGLSISPSYHHAIDAAIASAPTESGGMGRAIASLVGMNQARINQKVYEGAIGEFRQQIPIEAMEEGQERIAAETVKRNADLRSKGLVGNDTLAITAPMKWPSLAESAKGLVAKDAPDIRDFQITHLSLRSRPEAVLAGGIVEWRGAPRQIGADLPEPVALSSLEPGITANVHLGSLLGSLVAGVYERELVRSVNNLMLIIKDVPAGSPPGDAVKVIKNVDFATYAKEVDESRKTKPGTPRPAVLRISRPKEPPEFVTDARGFLVALIRDLQLDVPAPDQEANGGVVGAAAKIYHIKIPLLEVALSYHVDSSPGDELRIRAKIEDFNPGTNAEVLAITDDETKGKSLSRFSSAIVLGAVGGKLRSRPIDADLKQLKIPGISIRSISRLDPSGWMRVGLNREPLTPLAPVNPVPEVTPPKVQGPPTPTASTPGTAPAVGQRRGVPRIGARSFFRKKVKGHQLIRDRIDCDAVAIGARGVSDAVPAATDRRTGEGHEDRGWG